MSTQDIVTELQSIEAELEHQYRALRPDPILLTQLSTRREALYQAFLQARSTPETAGRPSADLGLCDMDMGPVRPHEAATAKCLDCELLFCEDCMSGRWCMECVRSRNYCCEDCDGPR